MSVGEYCNREVVIVERSESLRTAVDLMRTQHVGDVIVVDKENSSTKPIGVLTDRDIVVELIAKDMDLDAVNIGDVMSYELVTVEENSPLMDAIKLMRTKGIRRLPVVESGGGLLGILTADDVLALLAEQMTDLAALVRGQKSREQKTRL